MAEKLENLTLDSLRIAEVGTQREAEITEAIRNLKISLSATSISQIAFDVYDPNFEMLKMNYFQIRRPMSYNGWRYEITAVNLARAPGQYDKVSVVARSEGVQKMLRQKGAWTWDGLSSAEVALQSAKEFGLLPFIQQTPSRDSITRMQSEQTDESTWDVLRRLARDEEYMLFESYGNLYFSSEDYLLERQPFIKINCSNSTHKQIQTLNRPDENDPWYPYAFSMTVNDNETMGSMVTFKIGRENGKKLRPGMGLEMTNAGLMSGRRHLITDVGWLEGSNEPVTIKARTIKETKDTVADASSGRGIIPFGSRNLYMGIVDGHDIERLQEYLAGQNLYSSKVDGHFGTVTKAAVEAWQRKNKLGIAVTLDVADLDPSDRSFYGPDQTQITTYEVDGIINTDDWKIILEPPKTVRQFGDYDSFFHDEYSEAQRLMGSVTPDDPDSMAPIHDADKKWMY